MTSPQVGQDTATLVAALLAEARRLGLTWDIRPATVSATAGSSVTAVYDGDTVPVPMVNLAGWVPAAGARVMAIAVPPAGNYVIGSATAALAVKSRILDSFTTTSTAYTTAGTPSPPVCGVAFTAPPSGRVLLSFKAQMVNNSVGQFTICGFQLATGSTVGAGTVITAPIDDDCIANQSTVQLVYGIGLLIEDLNPGGAYNVQLMHRVTGGTGTIFRREVNVCPQW